MALVQIAEFGRIHWSFGELRPAMSKLSSIEELFAGRHFDREVIILCVRWYLRYKLSFRDLVEMMAERVLSLAHTTIMRWVRRYASEFVRRWNRFGRSCGRSWRVDETYINTSHARLQELCIRRQRDCWRRTSSSHPQTPVRTEAATAQRPSCAYNMECRACCISANWLPGSLTPNSLSCLHQSHESCKTILSRLNRRV
jgi:hypothetical protein